jgi:hypothetical protein
MPTPLLLLLDCAKKRYEQYGLVRNEFSILLELEMPRTLHSLMSDIKIISVFNFTTPYNLMRWCMDDCSDMFSELQLILANVRWDIEGGIRFISTIKINLE